jgi:propanol-preferring alcohol dehydrogenase
MATSLSLVTGMRLNAEHKALEPFSAALPAPAKGEVLVQVSACGVCRTDLHVVDGDIRGKLPIIPGHEIVGRVLATGAEVRELGVGDRVGVPWLAWACDECIYCKSGQENLCERALFTGFTRDGGYASHCLADSRYCLRIPERFEDVEAAPLLCAGLIGYRAYRKTGKAERLGLYGFGAAAHILAQVAAFEGRRVFAFTRSGDRKGQSFARSLGCVWAGNSDEPPPEPLDAAIIFAPVGALVPQALRQLRKGGCLVCAGIHMSDIPGFPYAYLWGERTICSVANLTRADGREFLALAARIPLKLRVTSMPLRQANQALDRLRSGDVEGVLVLRP